MVREVEEETTILLQTDQYSFFRTVSVRYEGTDFAFHIFHAILPKICEVRIKPAEHTDFVWVDIEEAFRMNLMPDEPECLELLYPSKSAAQLTLGTS